MLLAIDTSAGTSVAVIDHAENVLAEVGSGDTRQHAEVVGELIAQVLNRAGIDRRVLTGVVAGMGPGPFTGLRVGIAAVQAFAFALSLPVLRVASHAAVALSAHDSDPAGSAGGGPAGGAPARDLLIVTDARRREVAWSVYRVGHASSVPVRVAGPSLARPEQLEVVVLDYAAHTRVDAATVSAGSLARVARRMLDAGAEFVDTAPLYLRAPDVTLSTGPKRVSA